jgi:hypothetical protein
MALIQMMIEATRLLQTTAPIESLVATGVFESLARVRPIRDPLVSLMAHVKAAVPMTATRLDSIYSSFESTAPRAPRAGRDRGRILARFAKAREQFLATHGEAAGVADSEESEFVCAACREPIDRHTQISVLGWPGCSVAQCPHAMHRTCAANLNPPQCPVCRRIVLVQTPVLLPGFTPEQHLFAMESMHLIMQVWDPMRALNPLAQLIEYDPSFAVPEPFVKVLQSMILASARLQTEGTLHRIPFPLLHFAAKLPAATADTDFDRISAEIWPNGYEFSKSLGILWNSWVAFDAGPLTPRDLTTLKALPLSMFLVQLPRQFSDLFTAQFYGDQMKAATDDHLDFGCCLECGSLLQSEISMILGHARACSNMFLVMMMSGPSATSIFIVDPATRTLKQLPPVYVTEGGDDAVGLSLRLPLVLSEARVRALVRDRMTGQFDLAQVLTD